MSEVITKEVERKLIRKEKRSEDTLNMIRTRNLENLFAMEAEDNWSTLEDEQDLNTY